MKLKYLSLLVGVIFISLHSLAGATLITFDDKATFLAQTGAGNATGSLPNLGLIAGGAAASQTVGTVTFSLGPTSTELYVGPDWTPLHAGNEIAISGVENLNVHLASPVFSIGFDLVGASVETSTFGVTLKNGSSVVDSFSFIAPANNLIFVGAGGTTAFDTAEIREVIGTDENQYFGEFSTGSTLVTQNGPDGGPAIPNPEPTTLLLLGAGMVGVAAWRRKALMAQA